MASEWKETTLGKISEMQTAKVASTKINLANYISTENMQPYRGGIIISSGLPNQDKYLAFKKGDVLFSNIRTYFRKVWQASFDGGASNDVIVFRSKDDTKLDPNFLFYLISDERFIEHTVQTSKGTKMPRGDRSAMKSYELRVPDSTEEQKAIAHILGSLDDKIELNRQINQTLEQMAQAMFKSWFVDFEPVLDNALADENEIPDELQERAEQRLALGDKRKPLPENIRELFPSEFEFSEELDKWIPKGWKVGKITDLSQKIQNGGTPRRDNKDFWDNGSIPWLTSGEVRQTMIIDVENYITELGLEKSSAKWLPEGSTVVALYGATAGQVAYLATDLTTNQAVCGVIPKKEYRCYNYLNISRSVSDFENLAVGSAQQNISKGIVGALKTLIPNNSILEEFENKCSPIFKKWKNNLVTIEDLTRVRDTLLPKLISGEVRVGDLKTAII